MSADKKIMCSNMNLVSSEDADDDKYEEHQKGSTVIHLMFIKKWGDIAFKIDGFN